MFPPKAGNRKRACRLSVKCMTEACGRVSGVSVFPAGTGSADAARERGFLIHGRLVADGPNLLKRPAMSASCSASAEAVKGSSSRQRPPKRYRGRDPWAASDVDVFCWRRHIETELTTDFITRHMESLLSSGAEGRTTAPAAARGGEPGRSIADDHASKLAYPRMALAPGDAKAASNCVRPVIFQVRHGGRKPVQRPLPSDNVLINDSFVIKNSLFGGFSLFAGIQRPKKGSFFLRIFNLCSFSVFSWKD